MQEMDEELQKRNTDCVYFLASPLTCKKGIDCEYRHNEIARLNPRDCWYWLAGNCLNPTCGFRHPPMDGRAQGSTETASLQNGPYQCSATTEKASIPCFFYFNGFCNKGERCQFLHGPDGSVPAGKSFKTNALPLQSKASAGNDSRPDLTETHFIPSDTVQKLTKDKNVQPKEDIQLLAATNMRPMSISPQISASESEEADSVKSGSLLQAEGNRSHICTDQSSEDEVDDHVEPEERWESSPGFDVLVDNKPENTDYEDDPEYVPDTEHGEHFLSYDLAPPVQYDAGYCDVKPLYDQQFFDDYDREDNDLMLDHVRKRPSYSRERRPASIFCHKRRKLLPIDLSVDERNDVDLRVHLRNRRVIDGHPINHLSRRHGSSNLMSLSPERPGKHRVAGPLHGRLASEVRKHSIESLGEDGRFTNGNNQHGWLRHKAYNHSRQRLREKWMGKRQPNSSDYSTELIPRRRKSTETTNAFSGPKTLAQIKEEKKKAEENRTKMGHASRTMSVDFEGPKPLSEILKVKRKVGDARDGNNSSS